MKKSRMINAINEIDDDLITDALDYVPEKRRVGFGLKRLILTGFCLILCFGVIQSFKPQEQVVKPSGGNIMVTNPLYNITVEYNGYTYQVNLINYELNKDFSYLMTVEEADINFEDGLFAMSDEIYSSNVHPEELIIHSLNFNNNGEAYIKFGRIN